MLAGGRLSHLMGTGAGKSFHTLRQAGYLAYGDPPASLRYDSYHALASVVSTAMTPDFSSFTPRLLPDQLHQDRQHDYLLLYF